MQTDNFAKHPKKPQRDGEKDQICTLCPGTRFNVAGLKSHVKQIHTGGKYSCNSCDFVAIISQRLGNHVERIHRVHNCGKTSTKKKDLNAHNVTDPATQKGNKAIHKEAVHDGVIITIECKVFFVYFC